MTGYGQNPPQYGGQPFGYGGALPPPAVPRSTQQRSLNAALAALGVACVGLSFAPFYSYELKGASCDSSSIRIQISGGLCAGATSNAWHGVVGWLGVVLAAVGALIAVGRLVSPAIERSAGWAWAGAGAFGLGAVLELVAIGAVPDRTFTASVGSGGFDASIHIRSKNLDQSPAWAFWVVLVLILGGAAIAVWVALQTARAAAPRPTGYPGQPYPPPGQHGTWQQPGPPLGWQQPPAGWQQQGWGPPGA